MTKLKIEKKFLQEQIKKDECCIEYINGLYIKLFNEMKFKLCREALHNPLLEPSSNLIKTLSREEFHSSQVEILSKTFDISPKLKLLLDQIKGIKGNYNNKKRAHSQNVIKLEEKSRLIDSKYNDLFDIIRNINGVINHIFKLLNI